MKRIGSPTYRKAMAMARAALGLGLLLGWAAQAAAPSDLEFSQEVDRTEVGTDDAFRLTITRVNAPSSAELKLPLSEHFEIISRAQSTEMTYQAGSGGPGGMRRVDRLTLVMRAKQVGTFAIPPSVLVVDGRTFKTEPIEMKVRAGRVGGGGGGSASSGSRRGLNPQDPFQNFPSLPGFDDDDDLSAQVDLPRAGSDLFLRTQLDRPWVYVGQQVTLSLYIYSRVDLTEVSALQMPKLDGFWSEDIESPTQLAVEQKMVDGIPYRTYLLKRRALFPVKPGTLQIAPAEVDVVTGSFFSGRRAHRVGNSVSVEVRPLPAQGRPVGMTDGRVGQWQLTTELSSSKIELGQPVTLKVIVEGTGNLRNVSAPALPPLPMIRVFDPTSSEKVTTARGKAGGRRVQEYLLMPQRVGDFTIPSMALPYFDPELNRYEVSQSKPLALSVVPGQDGAAALGVAGAGNSAATKNVLAPGQALRPLRSAYELRAPTAALWTRPFFWPALAAPLATWLAFAAVGLIRGRPGRERLLTPQLRVEAARQRLEAAERDRAARGDAVFHAEVERALLEFLEVKLGGPVAGLTRAALEERLKAAEVAPVLRRQVIEVLEACDLERFAGGQGASSGGSQAAEAARKVMTGWGDK